MTANTANVRTIDTRRTDDVRPEFTQVISPRPTEADEIIEDGLALQAEIERYRTRDVSTLPELDEFFDSLQ